VKVALLVMAAAAPLATLAPTARAQMPLDPALRSKLQQEGVLAQVVAQLARARSSGWFTPAREQPVAGATDPGKRATWHALVLLVDFSDRPHTGAFGAGDFRQRLFSVGQEPTGSLAPAG